MTRDGLGEKKPAIYWLLVAFWLMPAVALAGPFGNGVSTPVSKTEQRLAMARLSERQSEGEKARAIYEQILKDDTPQAKAEAHHRLGVLDARAGKPEPAAAHFRQALAGLPNSAELMADAGYFNYTQGSFADAESMLRKAVELDPKNPAYKNNLALCLGRTGRMPESYQMFRAAGGEANAANNLGYLYAQQGKVDDAEKQYSRALTVNAKLRPAAEGLVQIARHKENLSRVDNEPARLQANDKPRLRQPSEPVVVKRTVKTKIVDARSNDADQMQPEPAGGAIETSDQVDTTSAILPTSRRSRSAHLSPNSESSPTDGGENINAPRSVLRRTAELEEETDPVAINTVTTPKPGKDEVITKRDGVRIVSDTPQTAPVVRINESGEVLNSSGANDKSVSLAAGKVVSERATPIPSTVPSARASRASNTTKAGETSSFYAPTPIERLLPVESPSAEPPVTSAQGRSKPNGRFLKHEKEDAAQDSDQSDSKKETAAPASTKADWNTRPTRKSSAANNQERMSWNGRSGASDAASKDESGNRRAQSWARRVIDESQSRDSH